MLVASGYWLHFRHTQVEAYAVETTAGFRANFLVPDSYSSGEVSHGAEGLSDEPK